MRGGSFESYDEAFASEGVVAGDAIDPRIEQGIPTTGREQTRYWSWCAGQFVSPVNVT
jgi:hypothetical protein